MVMAVAMNVCTLSDIPRIFEKEARRLSDQYALSNEGKEFLLTYVSTLTRQAFEVSEESEFELENMRRLESELLSLDSDGRFERALSDLKQFMWTFPESLDVKP